VDGGLAVDQALRAVTLGAAEILGAADRLGSLEVGKIANLTVVRGDLFAADARVTTVYVDGRPRNIPAPTVAGGAGARPGQGRPGYTLEGAWAMQVALDGVERYVTLHLRGEDDRLRGTLEGDLGASEVLEIEFAADGTVAFSASVTLPEGTEEARFSGKLEAGVFAGRVDIVGHDSGRFAGLRATTNNDEARERLYQER
jgi:hypothetical protein